MNDVFQGATTAQLTELIASHPMAWIVGDAANDTPAFMPVLLETDAEGNLTNLIGHLPKRHTLVSALTRNAKATFMFTGPNAYIAPGWLSNKNWAPTWNFCTAVLSGEVSFWPEGLDAVLERTVALMEAGQDDPWTVAQLGPRYETLKAQLVAFRAPVTHVAARFKLGQDERPEVLQEIIAGLNGHPLARWMRGTAHGG